MRREVMSIEEVRRAALVGVERRLALLSVPDAHGFKQTWTRWGNDIEGAAAEYVVARSFGKPWNDLAGVEARHQGDVGAAEVRATHHLDGRLLLHDSDRDEAPYILVVGACPVFTIVGWAYGAEGKQGKYRRELLDGRPCYGMPQHDLRVVRAA